MKRVFSREKLPWIVAGVFAIAFVIALLVRRDGGTPADVDATGGVVQDSSGRRVTAWIDPMYSQGPPHIYKSNKPGRAPDCNMKLVPLYAEEAPAGGTADSSVPGYSVVSLPPARQQVIGVKLGKAEFRVLSRMTRTVGRVTVDERLRAQIRPKFEGYVEQLYVNFTGQPVRRGQPLLSVYSPDLLTTQQELILAARNKTSFGNTLYEAARRRLLLWDMSAGDIERVARTGQPQRAVALRSPVDGVVLTKNVVQGARVMPNDTLYEIADLRRVWVLADIYESDLSQLRVGQLAQVTVSALGGRTFPGRVTFAAPTVSEATRTIAARIELDNPGLVLRPEMYADVVLQSDAGSVLSVPESAVLRTGVRSIVFVARGNGQFEPREVQTGIKAGGFYEIRRGVAAGETVAVDANFLIDSESRLKSAISGMGGMAGTAGASAATAPPPSAQTGTAGGGAPPMPDVPGMSAKEREQSKARAGNRTK